MMHSRSRRSHLTNTIIKMAIQLDPLATCIHMWLVQLTPEIIIIAIVPTRSIPRGMSPVLIMFHCRQCFSQINLLAGYQLLYVLSPTTLVSVIKIVRFWVNFMKDFFALIALVYLKFFNPAITPNKTNPYQWLLSSQLEMQQQDASTGFTLAHTTSSLVNCLGQCFVWATHIQK